MKYLIGKDRRKLRSRPAKSGTPSSPRISVFRSNHHTYVQAIDDLNSKTVASSSTFIIKSDKKAKRTELASKVGADLGDKLVKLKIKNAYFDRSGYKYHGRVKAVAEGVRASGVII